MLDKFLTMLAAAVIALMFISSGYLALTFVMLEANPLLWSGLGRALLVLFSGWVLWVVLKVLIPDDK